MEPVDRRRARRRRVAVAGLLLGVLLQSRVAHGETSTALGRLAASMPPGTWAELSTLNIAAVLARGNSGGSVLPYSMSAAWDGARRQLHFTGADHGWGVNNHVTYDAPSNRWMDQGATPTSVSHGYDHTTIDPATGTLYLREYGSSRIFSRPAGSSWSARTAWTASRYVTVAIGIDWWQGRLRGSGAGGSLLVYNCGAPQGQLLAWNPATGKWFADITGFGGRSTYHCFIEYSPPHAVAIFGGGNENGTRLWRLDADRTITALPEAPVEVGIQRANVTVDPVTGHFLVLGGGQLREYDPRAGGTWALQAGARTPPPGVGNPARPDLHGVISAPLANYGVVLYVTCRARTCGAHLYKHAAAPAPAAPAGGGAVR